jgi:hypothetical protein
LSPRALEEGHFYMLSPVFRAKPSPGCKSAKYVPNMRFRRQITCANVF